VEIARAHSGIAGARGGVRDLAGVFVIKGGFLYAPPKDYAWPPWWNYNEKGHRDVYRLAVLWHELSGEPAGMTAHAVYDIAPSTGTQRVVHQYRDAETGKRVLPKWTQMYAMNQVARSALANATEGTRFWLVEGERAFINMSLRRSFPRRASQDAVLCGTRYNWRSLPDVTWPTGSILVVAVDENVGSRGSSVQEILNAAPEIVEVVRPRWVDEATAETCKVLWRDMDGFESLR